MPGPLAGVRVVEIGQFVAGPMAAMLLADLGADVVKVEGPGKGDSFRTYGITYKGAGAFWLNVNRGKRSVALDLKQPDDARRCRELLERADVMISTSRPGLLESAGLDDQSLAAANPSLVRLYVSGYGLTGPRAGEPVYDNLVQGLTGIAAFQGGDRGPETLAPMVVDKSTALLVAQAITSALFARSRTGEGSRVEVSMLDVASYWNFPDMFQDRTFMEDDRRITRLVSPIATTTDGAIIFAPVTGRQLKRSAEALGHPEWVEELKQFKDHTILIAELMRRVESVTQSMTTAEVMARMREYDVPAAEVLDLDEHLVEPQVQYNQLYATEHDDELGDIRVVRYPAMFDGAMYRAPFTAPRPGADARSVAADWKLDWGVED